jgi:hypothetical protein
MTTSLRTIIDQSLPASLRRIKAETGKWLRYAVGRVKQVSEAPVFVLGNQKSGTTVIAAALAHCADITATLDLRDLTADKLTGVYEGGVSVRAFINRYRWAFSSRLIKEPNLTFLYNELADHFPRARFVLVAREPRDNLRSFLNGFHLPGHLEKLGSKHREALSPVWRAIVLNHGLDIDALNYVDGLAERWNRAVDVYLRNRDQVHLIRYEDFCSEKVRTIRNLTQRIGLDAVNDPTPIVGQQHQERGDRTVEWEEFFGAENLSAIKRRCRTRMKALDYL